MGRFFGLFFDFDDQQKAVISKLNENPIKSRRVIGRGTLTSDASEIRSTEKFQAYMDRASKFVSRN
ncbi:hypothetical protein [Agaribacter marinus]|uniref:Uncharacterized protein n=1 Tax=Agaribacter marinus TaxID=1431249 RepID=A0AA37SUM7_9ALTE|nr:hypothetical protein [Agaribacter marinus]GLR69462.1 hypothetical protein GCM10007852_03700 [Agaribacter marinus]